MIIDIKVNVSDMVWVLSQRWGDTKNYFRLETEVTDSSLI